MRDPHRHFTGALVESTRPIVSAETFHAAYDDAKTRLDVKLGTALYFEGTRMLISRCRAEGVDACTVVAGFCPNYEDSVHRFSAMHAAAADLDFDLEIRPCLIRSNGGFRNIRDVSVIRRVLLGMPLLRSVDICGPERRTLPEFEIDLEIVDRLNAISADRVAVDLPPLEAAMHVGEEIALGPELGVTQILLAVERGVTRLCHAHWLWADSAAPHVPGELGVHRDSIVDLVAAGSVHLEVCPTSSARLHGVSGITSLASDLNVELGTDNPALLRTELPDEIERWAQWRQTAAR